MKQPKTETSGGASFPASPVGRYDVTHIARTLRKMGEGWPGYHGNELHSAKDLLLDYQEQRGAVLRYLEGRERTGDHILLQEAGGILQGVYSPNNKYTDMHNIFVDVHVFAE